MLTAVFRSPKIWLRSAGYPFRRLLQTPSELSLFPTHTWILLLDDTRPIGFSHRIILYCIDIGTCTAPSTDALSLPPLPLLPLQSLIDTHAAMMHFACITPFLPVRHGRRATRSERCNCKINGALAVTSPCAKMLAGNF